MNVSYLVSSLYCNLLQYEKMFTSSQIFKNKFGQYIGLEHLGRQIKMNIFISDIFKWRKRIEWSTVHQYIWLFEGIFISTKNYKLNMYKWIISLYWNYKSDLSPPQKIWQTFRMFILLNFVVYEIKLFQITLYWLVFF